MVHFGQKNQSIVSNFFVTRRPPETQETMNLNQLTFRAPVPQAIVKDTTGRARHAAYYCEWPDAEIKSITDYATRRRCQGLRGHHSSVCGCRAKETAQRSSRSRQRRESRTTRGTGAPGKLGLNCLNKKFSKISQPWIHCLWERTCRNGHRCSLRWEAARRSCCSSRRARQAEAPPRAGTMRADPRRASRAGRTGAQRASFVRLLWRVRLRKKTHFFPAKNPKVGLNCLN